jgi:hypothetical protein
VGDEKARALRKREAELAIAHEAHVRDIAAQRGGERRRQVRLQIVQRRQQQQQTMHPLARRHCAPNRVVKAVVPLRHDKPKRRFGRPID